MLTTDQNVDIAGLAHRDLTVGQLCKQWSFEKCYRNAMLFEKLVEVELFPDQIQHALRIRDRITFPDATERTGRCRRLRSEVFMQQWE